MASSVPDEQFFGTPGDMIAAPMVGLHIDTTAFPTFDNGTFEDATTPAPAQSRDERQPIDGTPSSQASTRTTYQIREKVQARLNESYTSEQQEQVVELILDIIREQKQKTRTVANDAMIYVKALKDCVATITKLQQDTAALHEQATKDLRAALEPVQAHLHSAIPDISEIPASRDYHSPLANHDDFKFSGLTDRATTSPRVQDHRASVMPIQSLLNPVIEEEDINTPESLQRMAFPHELLQHDNHAILSFDSAIKPLFPAEPEHASGPKVMSHAVSESTPDAASAPNASKTPPNSHQINPSTHDQPQPHPSPRPKTSGGRRTKQTTHPLLISSHQHLNHPWGRNSHIARPGLSSNQGPMTEAQHAYQEDDENWIPKVDFLRGFFTHPTNVREGVRRGSLEQMWNNGSGAVY